MHVRRQPYNMATPQPLRVPPATASQSQLQRRQKDDRKGGLSKASTPIGDFRIFSPPRQAVVRGRDIERVSIPFGDFYAGSEPRSSGRTTLRNFYPHWGFSKERGIVGPKDYFANLFLPPLGILVKTKEEFWKMRLDVMFLPPLGILRSRLRFLWFF